MPDVIVTDRETGYPIEICVDCLTFVVGGEWQDEREGHTLAEHAAMMATAQHGSTDLTPSGPDYDDDPDGGVIPFSSSSCDGCGSILAGERHPAVVWFPREVTAPA